MRACFGRTFAPLLLAPIIAACSTSDTSRQATPDSASVTAAEAVAPDTARAPEAPTWYNRTRTIDLTGDRQLDTVRLVASGTPPDSLQITLSILVDGAEKHRERWGSSYELALLDSAIRRSPQVEGLLRARLDSVLASVVVQAFDATGVRVMAEDSATLAALEPRPTHRVSFSYGYESTTRLVWYAPRERFVRLWSCC